MDIDREIMMLKDEVERMKLRIERLEAPPIMAILEATEERYSPRFCEDIAQRVTALEKKLKIKKVEG